MHTAQFDLHADIEHRHWWFVARRCILAALVRSVLPPGAGRVLLDVGCGTGANLAALAEGYECVGADASPEALARARQRYPHLRWVHAPTLGALGELLRRADLVMLCDVLEHIDDDAGFLRELLEGMSPGSHLLITVPAGTALWSPHDEAFGHRRRYEPASLAALWRHQPVEVRLLSYFNARLHPLVRAMRALARRRGRSAGRAGTDFWLPPAPVNRLLTRIFAGETRRLLTALDNTRSGGYSTGVSLIALLRRLDAPAALRNAP